MTHQMFTLLERLQRLDARASLARLPSEKARLSGLRRIIRAQLSLIMRRNALAEG